MRDDRGSAKTGRSRLLMAGGVIAVVIALGVIVGFRPEDRSGDEDVAAQAPADAAAPQDVQGEDTVTAAEEVAPAAAPETAEATPAQETEPAAAASPSVDEVRLEADGVAVIAGSAEPGSTVSVLVDGQEVASAVADQRGDFAAIAVVAPDEGARVLSLRAESGGAVTASEDDIILAPVATAAAPSEAPQDQQAAGAEPAPATGESETAAEATANEDTPAEAPAVIALAPQAPAAPSAGAPLGAAPQAPEAAVPAQSPPTAAPAVPAPGATPSEAVATPAAPAATGTAPAGDVPQTVAVLKSTAEGVTLLQPSAPIAERIELDTIGYSDTGAVQLSGRASLEAVTVRVYLNNRTVVNLPVDDRGGWRGDLPEVDTGVYTLRVDAVDAAGKVTSRIETPFKREAPETLAAAGAGQAGPIKAITVQTGDTLWAIARDRYGEGVLFVRVFEANRAAIRDPDLIYPGQVFDLPEQ